MASRQIEAFEARMRKTEEMQAKRASRPATPMVEEPFIYQLPVRRLETDIIRPGNSVIGTVGEGTRRASRGGNFERFPRI